MTDLVIDIFPFALGILLLIGQPLIDAAWKRNVSLDEDALEYAEWAATVSAFLPNAVLTTFGAILIASKDDRVSSGIILCAVLLAAVVIGGMFIGEAIVYGNPGQQEPRFKPYNHLQIVLGAINFIGIILAIVFHFHDK